MPLQDSLTTQTEMETILASLERTALRSSAETFRAVEIGTRRAGTSMQILTALREINRQASFYGVDKDPAARGRWKRRLRLQKGGRQVAKFILGESQQVRRDWRPEDVPLDWIFIDGCHCEECALWDIEHWGGLVERGGEIVIHDTTRKRLHYQKLFQHDHTRRFGVVEAVKRSKLLRDCRLVAEIDDTNGVEVYERRF